MGAIGFWRTTAAFSRRPRTRFASKRFPQYEGSGSIDLRPSLAFRAPDLRALRILDPRPTRMVNARSCDEIVARQSVADMIVSEKNRCVRISVPGSRAAPFRGGFEGLAGTISGTIWATSSGPVT